MGLLTLPQGTHGATFKTSTPLHYPPEHGRRRRRSCPEFLKAAGFVLAASSDTLVLKVDLHEPSPAWCVVRRLMLQGTDCSGTWTGRASHSQHISLRGLEADVHIFGS
ncbi:hypothetical protein FZEAL_4436 [Fusarium zealandicum]|uniref:Uncharacterized protein n=1 Tax=Fusarium zealandicum TaxID=1053134 RepID=A0A8H4XLF8_9HYPO|nr:hypothetical protein FZEAL_4436 [Fusarium zealandicum]